MNEQSEFEEEDSVLSPESPLSTPFPYPEEIFAINVSLVLFGESNVGKSTLVKRFSGNDFVEKYNPTRDTKQYTVSRVRIDEKEVNLMMYDTAGEVNFRKNLMEEFLMEKDGIFIVYDCGNKRSYRLVTSLYKSVKKFCKKESVVFLIGNRADSEKKVVTTENGEEMASRIDGAKFYEVSAKTSSDEVFQEIIRTFILDCLSLISARKEVILNASTFNDDLDVDLRNNEMGMKAALKKDWRVLRLASTQLRNQKDLVLTAIMQNGESLRFASNSLRNDKSVVLTALKNNPTSFKYASRALRKDRDFVINKVIKKNVYAVRYANKALRSDPKVMLASLKRLGWVNLLNVEEKKRDYNLLFFTFSNIIQKKFRIIELENGNIYLGNVIPRIIEEEEDGEEETKIEGIVKAIQDEENGSHSFVAQGFGFEMKKKSNLRRKLTMKKKSLSRVFSGNYENGVRQGKGKEFDESNQICFEGIYKNGVRHGKGRVFQQISGNHTRIAFQGCYKNGKKQGMGEFFDPVKDRYVQGTWEAGQLLEVKYEYSVKFLEFSEIESLITYSPDDMLGSGTYGSIIKVLTEKIPSLKDEVKEQYIALKVFKREMTRDSFSRSVLLSDIKRSLELCSRLKFDRGYENIVKIYGVFVGKGEIAYAMELCKSSVDQIIRASNFTLEYDEKRRILYELSLGMESLHSINVMHRDLKWGNVLVNESGRVKITDFETLKQDQNEWRWGKTQHTATGRGTPCFLAPERSGKDYSLPVDVFSFGLMIYCLLFEKANPFEDNYTCSCGASTKTFTEYSFVEHVRDCDLRPILDASRIDRIPSEYQFLAPLMTLCWERHPSKRPKFSEIVQIFDDEQKKRKRYCIFSVELRFISIDQKEEEEEEEEEEIPTEKKYKAIRLLLLKPKLQILKSILEGRFPECNILSIENSKFGVIDSDSKLYKLIESEEEPNIVVNIDKEIDFLDNKDHHHHEGSSSSSLGGGGSSSSSSSISNEAKNLTSNRNFTLKQKNDMLIEEVGLLREEVARYKEEIDCLGRKNNQLEWKYERAVKMRDQLDQMNRKMLSVMKFQSSLNKK